MGEIMQEHEDIERLHSYSRFSCHFLTLFAAQMQTLKKKKKKTNAINNNFDQKYTHRDE